MDQKKEDEGIRPFDAVLRNMDDGSVHAELSKELHKLTGQLYEMALNNGSKAQKGEISLTVKLSVSANGSATLAGDVKVKTPKLSRVPSVMFITKGGNLSTENQRQTKLPLREAPRPNENTRELPADQVEARSV